MLIVSERENKLSRTEKNNAKVSVIPEEIFQKKKKSYCAKKNKNDELGYVQRVLLAVPDFHQINRVKNTNIPIEQRYRTENEPGQHGQCAESGLQTELPSRS